jgi:hypothetical protein
MTTSSLIITQHRHSSEKEPTVLYAIFSLFLLRLTRTQAIMIILQSSLLFLPLFLTRYVSAFIIPRALPHRSKSASTFSTIVLASSSNGNEEVNGISPPEVGLDDQIISTTESTEATGTNATVLAPRAAMLKKELFRLAEQVNRGFQATSTERNQVKDLIFQLAPLNPTKEPASPYYNDASKQATSSTSADGCTLSGKWTLIYTDAPDITSLDTSRNPLSTAQLGRIGQECSPPYIKNVIEWKRPEWARNLPFSGGDESRVLQKVVTSAEASPEKPRIVNLKVAGLELEAGPSEDSSTTTDLTSRIEKDGLIVGLLSANPVDLKGPLNPPFGQFEVLYLDEDLRIIKTYQNYLAVNRRIQKGEEWF